MIDRRTRTPVSSGAGAAAEDGMAGFLEAGPGREKVVHASDELRV